MNGTLLGGGPYTPSAMPQTSAISSFLCLAQACHTHHDAIVASCRALRVRHWVLVSANACRGLHGGCHQPPTATRPPLTATRRHDSHRHLCRCSRRNTAHATTTVYSTYYTADYSTHYPPGVQSAHSSSSSTLLSMPTCSPTGRTRPSLRGAACWRGSSSAWRGRLSGRWARNHPDSLQIPTHFRSRLTPDPDSLQIPTHSRSRLTPDLDSL